MQELTPKETIELLKPYHKGILETGLLEPLLKIAELGAGSLSRAAKTFYDAQASSILPQIAVKLMRPRLPYRVELLLSMGFEQSKLDFVLEDIINVFHRNSESNSLDQELDRLLDKYSNLKTEEIFISCSGTEIKK